MKDKQICNIHRFAYSGNKCPFCEQDRIKHLAHKFYKPKQVKINNEVTDDDLEKLKQKFNRR